MSPEVIVLLAGGALTLGYLIINQVILRCMILIGTALYIWYYAVVAAAPLWEAIFVSLAMGTANLMGLGLLLARRSKLLIPKRDKDLYGRFGGLPPGDFRTLMQLANRHVIAQDTVLTTEGRPVSKLYYIISGKVQAEKLGEAFTMPDGVFVGEVAYLTKAKSAASCNVAAGTEVLEWDFADLEARTRKSSRFKLALEAMISRDLAWKVSVAVAPELGGYRHPKQTAQS